MQCAGYSVKVIKNKKNTKPEKKGYFLCSSKFYYKFNNLYFISLALLAGTLRTTKRAACDDQMVSLSCPSTTIISVQFAQYGKAIPGGHSCVADPHLSIETEECLWPNPMQVFLFETKLNSL